MNLNSDDYLQEWSHVIEHEDIIKAEVLLEQFARVEERFQLQVLRSLGRAEPHFVIPMLAGLFDMQPKLALTRQEMLDVLLESILDNPDLLVEILETNLADHPAPFIEIAGQMQLDDAVSPLLQMLSAEQDTDLIQLILETLGNIGNPMATSVLSDYLYSGREELIRSAIQSLARIGTPTAVQRLAERLGTDSDLDLLILDAFSSIQDTLSLQKLNEAVGSHNAALRNHAKGKLVDIGSKAVPILINNLLHNDPDLQIHTLNMLALIGDISAANAIRKLLHNEPESANVRFAAYESLGMLPLDKGAYILAEGLSDPVEHVRIAAARAINQNLNPILLMGVRNLLQEREGSDRIVSAFLQAEAEQVILPQLSDDLFSEIALTWLREHAHPDLQNTWQAIFSRNGYTAQAASITRQAEDVSGSGSLNIWCVDDSRMILKIYQNTLHQLGYQSRLFEFPARAVDKLTEIKPDLLITDLNMPGITGLELTAQVRQRFTVEQLPIIMVTTQSDQHDREAARKAGVSTFLSKPFTPESLHAAIAEFFPAH